MARLMAYLDTGDVTQVHTEGCPALHPARLTDSKHDRPYLLAELADEHGVGGAALVHIDSLLPEFTAQGSAIHYKGRDTGWSIRAHAATGRTIAADPQGRTYATGGDPAATAVGAMIRNLVPAILHDLAQRRAAELRAELSAQVYRDMIAEGTMGTADAEQLTSFAPCTGLHHATLHYPHAPMFPRCEDVEPVIYSTAVSVVANLPADSAAEAIRQLANAVTRAGFTVFEPLTPDGADPMEIKCMAALGASVAPSGTEPSGLPHSRRPGA